MKISKSVLTGMTALSLFATSAATVTGSMTPVVSNASVHKALHHRKGHKRVRKAHKRVRKTHKRAVKRSYRYHLLNKVVSKGHRAHYYDSYLRSQKLTLKQARNTGWGFKLYKVPRGYRVIHRTVSFSLGNHNKHVYSNLPVVMTFVNKRHKAIKDSLFAGKTTHRISKRHFNRLYHSLSNYEIKGTF